MKIKTMFALFLISVVIFSVGITSFYEHRRNLPYQQALLKQIRELSEKHIVHVQIIPGLVKKKASVRTVLTRDEIHQMQAFFKDADTGSIGGHNYSRYECILIFQDEKNATLQFWGLVFGRYERNKNDLFLLGYELHEDFDSAYRESRLVRVKNLGRWLIEHGSRE